MNIRLALSTLCVNCLVTTISPAAAPQLGQLVPQGGQRGTEVEVSLRGARLGLDPKEVLWHETGIDVKSIERVDDNQTKVTLAVPDTLATGRYAMRLRTATGISNVMTFHVGDLPELQEVEPNSNPLAAQAIEFGSVVNGVVRNEDVDFFTFEAAAGEVIAVEVDGLRLGRTFFDPVITLLDDAGQQIAKCDDWPLMRQDACLTVVAPKDGKYTLELRESAYRGNDAATYRLHVGKFPRPLAVYPPGGRVGETIVLNWLGDAAGETTQEVTLPSEPTNEFNYSPFNDRGMAPSPHTLRVVDIPVCSEVEPNNKVKQATTGEAPGAFYGVLGEAGDIDYFRFAAKKGQVLHLRLHARRIGSPADAVLRIQNSDGRNLAGNDDDRGYPDSYIRFQAPDDGEYVAEVQDRLRRGDETFTYWLEARPDEAAVDLEFEEQQRYVAKLLDVPRGNRNGVMLRATRRNTGGELLIDWANLPPGVSVELHPLAGNYNRIPVMLSASDDAPLGQGLSTLSAHRTEDDAPVKANFTNRNWMVRGQNNVDMWNYIGSRAVIAVTEKAPYSIRIEDPKAPLVQRGTKNLKIVAERAEGFTGAILVRMLYNPPGVSANASLRIKENENEATIPVTANDKAQLGDWKILVRGQAESQGTWVTVTPFSTLKIAEPYVAMELPRPNVEQGNKLTFPIKIEQRTPFEGEAKVELIGLPSGVTTTPRSITKEMSEVVFDLEVAADARPGQHRGLFCRVTVIENGEPVVHSVGYGELRVDKPVEPHLTAQSSK